MREYTHRDGEDSCSVVIVTRVRSCQMPSLTSIPSPSFACLSQPSYYCSFYRCGVAGSWSGVAGSWSGAGGRGAVGPTLGRSRRYFFGHSPRPNPSRELQDDRELVWISLKRGVESLQEV